MMPYQSKCELAKKALFLAEKTRRAISSDLSTIIDPIMVAEKRGCDVRYLRINSLEGIYSRTPRPCIVIGSMRPMGRRNFTCAHELGHHLLGDGLSLDEINANRSETFSPTEFTADAFAGFFLMSQVAIRASLANRKIVLEKLTPWNALTLSSQFGVGYTTIITHMTHSLKLLSQEQCNSLIALSPKKFKDHFSIPASSEMIIVDNFWRDRAIDMQVGDYLIVPDGFSEGEVKLQETIKKDGYIALRAEQTGYTRLYDSTSWSANVRISRSGYEGLAKYRFLSDNNE